MHAKADREITRAASADCRECGRPFSPKNRFVRYCSDGCRSVAARRNNVERRRRHLADPEERAMRLARARAYAAAHNAGNRGERPPPPPRRRPRRRPASRNAGSPGRSARAAKPRACGLCGRNFAPYGRSRPVYCKRCRAKFDKKLAEEAGRARTLNCKECGKAFSAQSCAARYCSGYCRAVGRMRTSRESSRRYMADPRKQALTAARRRARAAARNGKEKGSAKRRSA